MKAVATVPDRKTLRALTIAARGCRACHLWRRATQTVFGEGTATAEVMLVGEQPGNDEDLSGKSFVGLAAVCFRERSKRPALTAAAYTVQGVGSRGALSVATGAAGYSAVHPSSILREPDSKARDAALRAFVKYLKKVKAKLSAPGF